MKILLDTCIYIDFFRSGKHEEVFTATHHTRFLSPIVMLELRAGALTQKQVISLNHLFYPYIKANRVIPLHSQLFYKAGEILAALEKNHSIAKRGFSHDILIALSALSIGSTLFTSNRKDFELIAKWLPLKVHFI